MSKHKKTREQKIISDLRHKLSLQNELSNSKLTSINTVNLNYVPRNFINNRQKTVAVNISPHFFHDLLKTGILTGVIIILQFVLFFLLKNHILVLPMVKY